MNKLAYFVLTAVLAVSAAFADEKINVLLITGDDVSPSHNWFEASQAIREVLVETGRFEVRVSEDPLILESQEALDRYDVIVFAMYNRNLPTINDQAKENLLNFVKGGKGFVVKHLASASFNDWPEFGELCGRYWVMGTSGHGPRKVFESRIVKDHPITRGLRNFLTDDELYAKLQGDAEIEVLVEADSSWSEQTEPLVFIREYGEGRVFHTAYGHDRTAIMFPSVKTLLARGTEWAATGDVKE